MNKLLIYIDEGQCFDLEKTVHAISSMTGISHIQRGDFIGASFECRYAHAGRITIVRISKDLETVTVEGLGHEAADFAVKFQQCFPIPLHVIDLDYSFQLDLTNFDSGSELISAVNANR